VKADGGIHSASPSPGDHSIWVTSLRCRSALDRHGSPARHHSYTCSSASRLVNLGTFGGPAERFRSRRPRNTPVMRCSDLSAQESHRASGTPTRSGWWLYIGERSRGPIFLGTYGQLMDRRAAA